MAKVFVSGILAAAFIASTGAAAIAGNLVYRPINPGFGLLACHLSVYSGTPELRQRQARLHEFDDAAKPAGEPGGFAPRHFLGLMG
jgi:hypothetical protein